jgi:hypothetical protein
VVGAAAVLHRWGGRAAVAVSVGVAGGAPEQQCQTVRLRRSRQPQVAHRSSPEGCCWFGDGATATSCRPMSPRGRSDSRGYALRLVWSVLAPDAFVRMHLDVPHEPSGIAGGRRARRREHRLDRLSLAHGKADVGSPPNATSRPGGCRRSRRFVGCGRSGAAVVEGLVGPLAAVLGLVRD